MQKKSKYKLIYYDRISTYSIQDDEFNEVYSCSVELEAKFVLGILIAVEWLNRERE